MKSLFKTCKTCLKEFPKTDEFFNYQNRKDTLVDGTVKTYKVARAHCKKCHYAKTTEINILKRCREVGIERSEWEEFKTSQRKKQLELLPIFQFKDESIKHLPRRVRATILKKIREDNYVFVSYEQYKKDIQQAIIKRTRKYDYDTNEPLTSKDITERMPDYYVAMQMRRSVKDVPKELIELKRLVIQVQREIKKQEKWKTSQK